MSRLRSTASSLVVSWGWNPGEWPHHFVATNPNTARPYLGGNISHAKTACLGWQTVSRGNVVVAIRQ